jgi:hypothetical protein
VVEGVRRLFFTKVTGEKIKEHGTDGIKAAMVGLYKLNAVDPCMFVVSPNL